MPVIGWKDNSVTAYMWLLQVEVHDLFCIFIFGFFPRGYLKKMPFSSHT